MCTPAAGILLAVTSMAQQGLAIQATNQQIGAAAQTRVTNAAAQTRADLTAIEKRKAQVSEAITLDQVRRYAQGRRERSTLAARLADAGISGGSTVRDAVASVIQEEMDVGTLEVEEQWQQEELTGREVSAVNRYKSAVNASRAEMDSQVTGLPGVLSMVSAGVSGYATGRRLQPRNTDWKGAPVNG